MRLNGRGWRAGFRRIQIGLCVALLIAGAALALGVGSSAPLAHGSGQMAWVHPGAASTQEVATLLSQLPLIFEPNQGQTDSRVKFLARGHGYGIFLTGDEAVLALRSSARTSVVRMSLAHADSGAQAVGFDPLPGRSNYFIGNDPAKWHRNIPQFARVRYRDVYPGIDLVYYGSGGQLEYDFEVAPNADPGQVNLQYQGPDKLTLQPGGDLALATAGGELRLQAPRVYQKFGDEKRVVEGRFVLRAKNEVGFELGPYDHSRLLVIDPVLTYSSFLGGSGNEACSAILGTGVPVSGCPAIAVDSGLNLYVAGSTASTDFPVVPVDTCPPTNTPHAFQCALAGTANIFVTKFAPVSSGVPYTIAFSTYLGGDGIDTTAGVAFDSAFNVFVAGTTSSSNFPTIATNAFQTAPLSTGNHVFVSKLQFDGTALLYSTYLSGTGTDIATGLALDVKGKVYVSGTTTSNEVATGFPSTGSGFQTSPKAAMQFFFTRLDPIAASPTTTILYSTYLGGSLPSTGVAVGGGIAVDSSLNVYVTGGTDFTDMPVLNAFQGTNAGGKDIFLGKFAPSAATNAQELYLTYLGGPSDDIGNGVAVDSGGSTYVTGSTASNVAYTLPTGVVPFQAANAGGSAGTADAFMAKFGIPCTGTTCTTTAVPLNYFTYIGGTGADIGLAIAVDASQGAHLTGSTTSTDLPLLNSFTQGTSFGGGVDGFVARIDTLATTATATGHSLSYLGGGLNDAGTGIITDAQSGTVSQGTTYVAGETMSANFPTVNPLQAGLDGTSDAFIARVGPTINLAFSPAPTVSPAIVGVGSQITFKYSILNSGDQVSNVTLISAVPPGATFVSANLGTGTNTCAGGTTGTVVCNIGSLNSGATATANIVLVPIAPTPPNTTSVSLSDSAVLSVAGANTVSGSATATVNDFNVGVGPASQTVVAGVPASYTVTVSPTGTCSGTTNACFPASVSLSCSSGLPAGGSCMFTTTPLPNLDNGPASTALIVNTTMRTTTTVEKWPHGGPLYATWVPVSGLALLGVGIGGKMSRKRRVLGAILLAGFFSLILLQPACGGGRNTTTTTTGTPAGTYTINVSATSGSPGATRTTSFMLVVK